MMAPLTLAQAHARWVKAWRRNYHRKLVNDPYHEKCGLCRPLREAEAALLALPSAPQEPPQGIRQAMSTERPLWTELEAWLLSKQIETNDPRYQDAATLLRQQREMATTTAEAQIGRLATFIMENIPGEPSRSEGAIDCAIRLLASAPQTISTEAPQEPQAQEPTQTVGSGSEARFRFNFYADRWTQLRDWLIELTSDGETAGIIDETEVLAKMRELEAAAAPAQGWQPIATAPKDGTAVLIHLPSRDLIGEARWQGEGSDEGWWWAGTDPGDYHSSRIEEYEVAHWMPLPAPPSAPTPGQEREG